MRERAKEAWRDLRERRLWPVALALLVALVLVPLVALEPAPELPPAPPPARPPATLGSSPVALETPAELVAQGSNLDLFALRDPFRRPASARRRSAASASSATRTRAPRAARSEGAPTSASDSAGASSGSGGGATSAPRSSSPPSDGSGASGGESGSGGSPAAADSSPRASDDATGGGDSGSDSPVGAESARYTDVVDIRFGERGEERTRSAVMRMAMLPHAERPVVTFLGLSASGRSAVFLFDSGIAKQAGDGSCDPSPTECRLLSLRLDRDHDQHFFTDTAGRKYSLRLLAIDRMPVREALARQARLEGGRGATPQ